MWFESLKKNREINRAIRLFQNTFTAFFMLTLH